MLPETPVNSIDIVAPRPQRLIVVLVLAAVEGLLPDKATNLGLQLRVFDSVPVEPYSIDELLLTIGKLE